MAPLTLRVRYPWGAVTLAGLSADTTVAQLRELIAEETGLTASRQLLKVGVPPLPLEAGTLAEAGVHDHYPGRFAHIYIYILQTELAPRGCHV